MENKSTNRIGRADRIIPIAIGLAVLYWIVESAISAFVFHKGNIVELILGADGRELWIRPLFMSILIAFGIYAQLVVTNRSRTLRSLHNSEARFRSTVQAGNDAIISIDSHGSITFWNRAAEVMFGYSVDEVINKPLTLIMPERFHQAYEEGLKRVVTTEESRLIGKVVEMTGLRKDGREFPLELSLATWKTSEGTFFTAIVRDITERKRAEEAMTVKDSAIASSIDAVAFADLERNLTYVNPSFLELWGYDNDREVVGKPAVEFWQMGDQAAEVLQALKNRGSWLGELVALRRDGSTFDAYLSASMVTDEHGKPVCMMASFVDITERKRAEEALKESEERYRLLAANVTDVIWTMDLNLRYTYVSPSVTRQRGYSVEEVLSQTAAESLTPVSLEIATKALAEELAVEELEQKDLSRSRTLELELNCKNGATVWTEVSMTFLRDQDDQPVGILGVSRDISERKQMEETIEHLAYHDALTDLPNRMLLNDRFNMALAHAQHNQQKLALMSLDLDYFKNVNDTLGHNVGDRLLKAVGDRLTSLLRKADTKARMGGDEFMLLLPGIGTVENAANVAQKTLEAVRKPFVLDGHELHITTSIGVAMYPDDGEDADTLMKKADLAMYCAKEHGRDNYQCHTPAANVEAVG